MEATRQTVSAWLCLLFSFVGLYPGIAPSAHSQELVLRHQNVYLSGDTIRVDLQLDSLFSNRSRNALESGMTTSITIELQLEGNGGFRRRDRVVATMLEHDIWEGRYLGIRQGSRRDTLETRAFREAERFCTELTGVSLGPTPPANGELVLRARVSVNPITEEQHRRTRKWLNFLHRGSILELFISLDTSTERTDWLDVARFRSEDLK